MATRKALATISLGVDPSQMSRGLSTARSQLRSFAAGAKKTLSKAFGASNKMGGGVAGIAGIGAGLLGAGGIGDVVNSVRDFERSLMRLGNEASIPDDKLNALRATMTKLSSDTSISREDLVASSRTYFDLTSDVDGMTAALATFARTAQATGASTDDVTRIGAALQKAGVSASDMESAMSGLVAQGSAGKIGMADQAKELVSLAPKFMQFGAGKGRDSVMKMGAAFQVVAEDVGSASEAATRLEAMMGMLGARQKQLASAGVEVFNKDGTKREIDDIVGQIRSNKKLQDKRNWGAVFGEEKEGRGALESLLRLEGKWNDVYKAGAKADEVAIRFNRTMASSSGGIDAAMNRIKLAVAEAFTPERIKDFADALEDAADKAEPIIAGLSKIGSLLGMFHGAGQAIRGAFAGEANPYAADAMKARLAEGGDPIAIALGRGGGPKGDKAKTAEAQRAAFAATRDSIMAGELNERSSPESIRRAVLSSYRATNRNASPEDRAAASAGSMYLDAAKVSPQQGQEIYGKAMIAELVKIRDAIRTAPAVNLDGNKVNSNLQNTTGQRK